MYAPRPHWLSGALLVCFLALSCPPLHAERPKESVSEKPVSEVFSISVADAPYFSGLTILSLTQNGQREELEGWPGMVLVWKDEELFLEKNGKKIQKLGVIPLFNGGWWPSVSYADIDFDGTPEFFLLHREAMTGSRYRLVSSSGAFPTSLFQSPPPSLVASDALLFKDGISPEPAFFPESGSLEFYERDGPYYTAERWHKSGASYHLAHQRRAIYSPEVANTPMAFMEFVQFNEHNEQTSVTYHSTQTTLAPLRYQALLPIPLFPSPSFKTASSGTLKPGTWFEVIAYEKNSDDNGDDLPVLWLKAKDTTDGRIGWVSLDVMEVKIEGYTLVPDGLYNPQIADYLKQPAKITGMTEKADGIDLTVQRGNNPPFSLRLGEPIAVSYQRYP